jgi:four helix bundle protein
MVVFEVEEIAVQLIEGLRPLVPRIKARDRALADQLMRAASSVALNVGESNYSDPGNRRARLFTAAGSANETRMALRVAASWGYCGAAEVEAVQALIKRILSMLWKLTRG